MQRRIADLIAEFGRQHSDMAWFRGVYLNLLLINMLSKIKSAYGYRANRCRRERSERSTGKSIGELAYR